MMDLSLLESLSSRAITTQLAMMVRMIIHSKGGQLTSQVIRRRTGLVGVKRKREVGPRSSGSSFFFLTMMSGWSLVVEGGEGGAEGVKDGPAQSHSTQHRDNLNGKSFIQDNSEICLKIHVLLFIFNQEGPLKSVFLSEPQLKI